MAERKPDVLLTIYNDHISSCFFDHYSAFALGVDYSYAAMRGKTLEEFQKTRNDSVQYSVAGGEKAQKLSELADS